MARQGLPSDEPEPRGEGRRAESKGAFTGPDELASAGLAGNAATDARSPSRAARSDDDRRHALPGMTLAVLATAGIWGGLALLVVAFSYPLRPAARTAIAFAGAALLVAGVVQAVIARARATTAP